MIILSFAVKLFGATMLLLFAVSMVSTGIERAYGASFRRLVTTKASVLGMTLTGVMLAMILQSSAAVTLLVAGFSGTSAIGFSAGMAIVLGGDLGSALLIRVLTLDIQWIVPVLLGVGGFLFLKTQGPMLKQAGRIAMGIALILISLRFLRETMDPIRESAFLPAIADYLVQDYLTAFITGVALAFVMHSSVAVILICVTLVAIGALPQSVGLSLVLGANLGSALIPVWLTRGMSAKSRRIPLANLIIRGTVSVIVLFAINQLPTPGFITAMDNAHALVTMHILFNLILLLSLPFVGRLQGLVTWIYPDNETPANNIPPHHHSVLHLNVTTSPKQSLTMLQREVLRMATLVSEMIAPAFGLLKSFDAAQVAAIRADEAALNNALDHIRQYSAGFDHDSLTKSENRQMRNLVDYAISLEAAGDIVVKRLIELAGEKDREKLRFSDAGFDELRALHERIARNVNLATNVLLSADIESARLLLEEKAAIAQLEQSSRKKHLHRLSSGDSDSLASSDIHLETAYSLKEFHSWIVKIAHPILVREGQLLETRLIQKIGGDENAG